MITVNDIAGFINGKVLGDGDTRITGMKNSDFAVEGDLTFAVDEKSFEKALNSKASCVLTTEAVEGCEKTLLCVEDMKYAMTVLYNAMLEISPSPEGEIHENAVISSSAVIGDNAFIEANAVVRGNAVIGDNVFLGANCVLSENVKLGDNCKIHPNVTIYEGTSIGNNVIIHSGTVIGADGFGYVPKDGKVYKVPQMGRVIIEDDVEIGANSCIDRGTFTDTVVGRGTKIDNLVQIAHNNKLGKNVLIAAQVGISGSVTVGDNTMMGGQVGIADHRTIGKDAKIAAQSGVARSVSDGEIVLGTPARPISDARKLFSLLSFLLKHSKKFRALLREDK